ncbi:MAG: DUF3516 domain-containing protein [Micrococcales bacterium]|nr:DUF3516 domain-containing protein [Micrococcales bacterium]
MIWPGVPVEATADQLYEAYLAWAVDLGYELYPHQDEAVMALATDDNLILSTPTGTGKSLVAAGALAFAVQRGGRAVYTAPIKALVSEKFFDLASWFGADKLGLMTGDASVNPEAPIICCTAEVLAHLALRHGQTTGFETVVMDEFHYYADPDRGWAWQVPLLEMTNSRFALMSATLGDVSFFKQDLQRRTGRPVTAITDAPRPVPLSYEYELLRTPELVTELIKTYRTPAYLVHFTQREAVEAAGTLLSLPLIGRDQQDQIGQALGDFKFKAGFGQQLSKLVRRGIGVHHAGMLPVYRRLVERLAGEGLLAVICGTDTLGVGINVPIRSVVLTSLVKFDGRRLRRLKAREFHQIAGRAGRAGYDSDGHVIVQAPAHAIEQMKAQAKAQATGRKTKKTPAAPKGQVSWSQQTLDKLKQAEPEKLVSQMRFSAAMALQLLERPGDPVKAAYNLLSDNHEPKAARNKLLRQGARVYRALKSGDLVTHSGAHSEPPRIRLTAHLPADFALNQPLTPFALAAIELLDPDSDSYALDVVSCFEATLEGPKAILIAQEKAAKSETLARIKAEGWDYYERMDALDQVTYPEPLKDMLEAAMRVYRQGHPWVDDSQLEPKSIVRLMREGAMTFHEFVSRFGVVRTEGGLLRYLTDAYHALDRSTPATARKGLAPIVGWLEAVVTGVDSSLLTEWEELVGVGSDQTSKWHPSPNSPTGSRR